MTVLTHTLAALAGAAGMLAFMVYVALYRSGQ